MATRKKKATKKVSKKAAKKRGAKKASGRPLKAKGSKNGRKCSVCGVRGHNRRSHGPGGRR